MNATTALDVRVTRRLAAFTLDVAFTAFTGGTGITALLGPSGAGKSLTLRAIAGLARPDTGRIALGGAVLFDAERGVNVPARARSIGYMFQQYAIFPHLSVASNVGFGLHTHPAPQRARDVDELLALVGLGGFGARRPHTLSGGQLQRVALARALAPRPRLLLLDEPLAALDVPLRRQLGASLRMLHERTGTPMLLVTHDPQEADALADATVRLEGGAVVAANGFA